MVDAIHEGKLKSMYLFGEEMSAGRLQRQLCGRTAFAKLDFFVVQDIFFSHDVPVRRRGSARVPEPGKRGNVHQHRAARFSGSIR